MSQVITREIDLRPRWVQSFSKRNASPRSRSLFFIGSGIGALVLVMFAFSKDPSSNEKRASVAAAAIVDPPAEQIEKPIKDDTPIVIEATREPDTAVAPAIEPAKTGTGKVKLDSDPHVVVFAGQRRLGRTPLEVSLPAGTHELRFVDKAKHLEVKRKIDVKAGGNHSRELNFGIGALRVRAPEGTKLWLNKKYAGSSPFKRIELAEGRHRLKLKKGAEVVEEWIAIPPSQTVDYRVNFSD